MKTDTLSLTQGDCLGNPNPQPGASSTLAAATTPTYPGLDSCNRVV